MIAPHLEPPYYAVVFYTITEGNFKKPSKEWKL
jgi:hypothetical protein